MKEYSVKKRMMQILLQFIKTESVNNYSKSHTLNNHVLDVDYLQLDGSTVTW